MRNGHGSSFSPPSACRAWSAPCCRIMSRVDGYRCGRTLSVSGGTTVPSHANDEPRRRNQHHGATLDFVLSTEVMRICTNHVFGIQVATHADSMVAEAAVKNITGFDLDIAYEAVYKDATVPPVDDWTIS